VFDSPMAARATPTTLYVESGATGTMCSGPSSSQACPTISDAVGQAQSGDTIEVGTGYFEDNVTIPSTLTGLIIEGSGSQQTFVAPNTESSVFIVDANAQVSLVDLYVEDGEGDSSGNGGNISNRGTLSVTDSTITNGSPEDNGGNIWNDGSLSVTDSTLTEGDPDGNGGAVYNATGGTATLTDDTVYENYGYEGGAVYNGGTATLTGDTLQENEPEYGGGMYNTGTATLTDDTVYDNNATGGGFDNTGGATLTDDTIDDNDGCDAGGLNTGQLLMEDDTVAGNSSDCAAGGLDADGTSSLIDDTFADNQQHDLDITGGTTTVAGTLLTSGCVYAADTISDGGYNIDEQGTCDMSASTSKSGVDPLLGPLSDNGGPTETMIPEAAATSTSQVSPALDQIPLGTMLDGYDLCGGTDQRGVSRPQAANCTEGSVEVENLTCDVPDQGDVLFPTAFEPSPAFPAQVTEPAGIESQLTAITTSTAAEATVSAEAGVTQVTLNAVSIPIDASGPVSPKSQSASADNLPLGFTPATDTPITFSLDFPPQNWTTGPSHGTASFTAGTITADYTYVINGTTNPVTITCSPPSDQAPLGKTAVSLPAAAPAYSVPSAVSPQQPTVTAGGDTSWVIPVTDSSTASVPGVSAQLSASADDQALSFDLAQMNSLMQSSDITCSGPATAPTCTFPTPLTPGEKQNLTVMAQTSGLGSGDEVTGAAMFSDTASPLETQTTTLQAVGIIVMPGELLTSVAPEVAVENANASSSTVPIQVSLEVKNVQKKKHGAVASATSGTCKTTSACATSPDSVTVNDLEYGTTTAPSALCLVSGSWLCQGCPANDASACAPTPPSTSCSSSAPCQGPALQLEVTSTTSGKKKAKPVDVSATVTWYFGGASETGALWYYTSNPPKKTAGLAAMANCGASVADGVPPKIPCIFGPLTSSGTSPVTETATIDFPSNLDPLVGIRA